MLEELGAGHFGAVYLAVGEVPGRGMQPGRRRVVAIKKLKDARDSESVRLLLQEFDLLDQVKHRSVVRVFEYLEDEHAVVMEHIHGVTLRAVLDELANKGAQVFTEAAVEMGCEIADALYQAYTTPGENGESLQLVHRDLKPDNIMLTPSGDVKILDWGLARVDNADFRAEASGRLRGTALYMSPEQASRRHVDHRSDLFGLGLILYELLMGESLYGVPEGAADPLAAAMAAIQRGDTGEACKSLEKRLPVAGPVITKALQPRPEDRYRDGQDLLVELRRSLYRDRGAYLEEFCAYFFEAVHPLADPPTVESLGGRSGGRGKRMSIEERLRQSMAEGSGAPAGSPPEPVSQVVAPGRPPAPRTGRPPPRPPRPSRPQGADMAGQGSNGEGPFGRPRPPVGGGASRSTPFRPASASRPPRPVGQRRPDETGMLEMVPINQNEDEVEAAGDPSATAFFAIPAPRAERNKPAAPPPPMGGGPGAPPTPQAFSGGAPPPPPGMGRPPAGPPSPAFSPSGPPPPPAMHTAAGMPPRGPMPPQMGGHAPPQPMVQGPIASYGGAQTPFQVAGAQPADAGGGGREASRTQSQRVYAVVLGVIFLMGIAITVAVWLRPGQAPVGPTTSGSNDGAAVVSNEKPTKKPKSGADTGQPPPVKPPPKAPRSAPSTSTKSTTPKPAAAPKTPSGTLNVRLKSDHAGISAVQVQCPGTSFRQRKSLSNGMAVFSGVPNSQCKLTFQGTSAATFTGVSGGMSVSCSITGTQAICT